LQIPAKLLGFVCVAVVCVMLCLGLWPFVIPQNQVEWSRQGDGVVFGKTGTIAGDGVLTTPPGHGDSVEVWAKPNVWTNATVLALYRPEKGLTFKLRQSLTDLEVEYDADDRGFRPDSEHFIVKNSFGPTLHRGDPVFLTVTSGPQEIRVYVNGNLAGAVANFPSLDTVFAGRVIVGDAPLQPDSFRGKIRGLAIHGAELSAAEVTRNYLAWTRNGRPAAPSDGHYAALYLFDEGSGRVIHDRTGTAASLLIPERYTVVDKVMLEPFWREFDFSGEYWRGNVKNIIGFIPLGFIFCMYFQVVRHSRRPGLATVAVGTAISVTIEVLQAFLPPRNSGTTDIITNTFGTWLGVLLWRRAHAYLSKRAPASLYY
jgi:VanZ like family/Concanavalin A-like lectin/glucanases superfamily